MNTLFDLAEQPKAPEKVKATTPKPSPKKQFPKPNSVAAIIASELLRAGRVRVVGGNVQGGLTLQQLQERVTERRGKHTKETTLCQPLKDLRRSGYVQDSQQKRLGNAGIKITVWQHRKAKETS